MSFPSLTELTRVAKEVQKPEVVGMLSGAADMVKNFDSKLSEMQALLENNQRILLKICTHLNIATEQ